RPCMPRRWSSPIRPVANRCAALPRCPTTCSRCWPRCVRTPRSTPRPSARGGGERPDPRGGAIPARGAGVHHLAPWRGEFGAALRPLQPGQLPWPGGRRPGGGGAQPRGTGEALRAAVGAALAAAGAWDAGGEVRAAPTPALPRRRGREWVCGTERPRRKRLRGERLRGERLRGERVGGWESIRWRGRWPAPPPARRGEVGRGAAPAPALPRGRGGGGVGGGGGGGGAGGGGRRRGGGGAGGGGGGGGGGWRWRARPGGAGGGGGGGLCRPRPGPAPRAREGAGLGGSFPRWPKSPR